LEAIEGLLLLLFGQNHQSFDDVSDFDDAEGGEEGAKEGDFIIGAGNHG
jgi:hypothetical protein